MTFVPIPAWNAQGVIPPVNALNPISAERSPYPVSLIDFVDKFSTSPERRKVLQGFLRYRAALHATGLIDGFQWLNGSFLEDVETLEGRAPRDLDVVTFIHTPVDLELNDEAARLFDQAVAKERFRVDAHVVELDYLTPRELTSWSAYWYSLWSHRRNQVWKGFLQIELAPDQDEATLARLAPFAETGEP
jgi:hypothetical protein